MADNKQYITQAQENGTVMISEDVIISIATQAISDVEGIVSINSKPAAEKIRKNWGRGIKITIAEDNSVTIDVQVLIGYGQSVVAIAEACQKAIISAVQSMTGVDAITVNVNVSGIVRQ